MAEQASQEAMSVTLSIRDRPTASCCSTKRLVLRVLVGVLFTVVHLLLERLRLLLVRKRESSQAFFQLESVEEDAILVVREGVVYLLVPDDATVGRLHNVSMSYTTSLRTLTEMSTSLIQ